MLQQHHKVKLDVCQAERAKEFIQVYCEAGTFLTLDEEAGTPADQIIFDSKVYKVMNINLWEGQHLTHDEVLAVRVEAS